MNKYVKIGLSVAVLGITGTTIYFLYKKFKKPNSGDSKPNETVSTTTVIKEEIKKPVISELDKLINSNTVPPPLKPKTCDATTETNQGTVYVLEQKKAGQDKFTQYDVIYCNGVFNRHKKIGVTGGVKLTNKEQRSKTIIDKSALLTN